MKREKPGKPRRQEEKLNSGEPERNQKLERYDNMLRRCLLKQLFIIFIKIQRLVTNTGHRSIQTITGQLCIFHKRGTHAWTYPPFDHVVTWGGFTKIKNGISLPLPDLWLHKLAAWWLIKWSCFHVVTDHEYQKSTWICT